MKKTMAPQLPIRTDWIREFCQRWQVKELALFGSVVRDDFSDTSDVDVLVTFEEDAPWSAFDVLDMRREIETNLSRKVDLVEEPAISNPYRKKHILAEKQVVYAEG